MNKHEVLLDMIKNKILFISRRYEYDYNITFNYSDLSFIFNNAYTLILRIILKYSLISIVEDKIIRDIDSLLKDQNINILEIEVVVYYRLTRDKNNKLFSLIINKNNIASLTSRTFYNSYILVNKLYLYRSKRKYKKCYESNIFIYINKTEILTHEEILVKLSSEYYNYIDVFDRMKTNELLSYRIYDYKLKFTENRNKIELFKSRIYFIFDYKLKQVKKYLDEYLKKDFIVSSYTLFVSLVLFAEKLNNKLRFYIDY